MLSEWINWAGRMPMFTRTTRPGTYKQVQTEDGSEEKNVSGLEMQPNNPLTSQGKDEHPATHGTFAGCFAGLARLQRLVWESGTACVVIAAWLFSIMALCVKLTHSHVPTFQIVATRSICSFFITALVSKLQGTNKIFGNLVNMPLLVLRGAVGAAAMTAYFMSIDRLPLADAVTIFFVNPVITAIAAWPLLKEPLGWRGAGGCAVCMVGVVVLMHPPFLFGSSQGLTARRIAGIVWGVVSAIFAAAAFVVVRKLGKAEPAAVLALWFHTLSALTSMGPLAAGFPKPAVWPSLRGWGLLSGVVLTSFSGQIILNRGFQLEAAGKMSAVNLTQVLYSYILGIVFLGDTLTLYGVLGSMLVAAGVVAVNVKPKPAAAAGGDGVAAEPCSSPPAPRSSMDGSHRSDVDGEDRSLLVGQAGSSALEMRRMDDPRPVAGPDNG